MATYIPNATQTTEPVESRTVESAALEFRTLKASINTRITAEESARIAGDANLQTQNNSQDVRLTAVENALLFIGEGGLPGTVYVQRLSGTGAQTVFTLNTAPQSGNAVDIYINGLYQNKDTFTVSGADITFSEAPPAGTNNIEVQITETIALGETDASLVSYLATASSPTVRTVESKLREVVSVKDFGAVGDGVADDTAAFRAFVAHLSATGAEGFMPAGVYLTDPLVTTFRGLPFTITGAGKYSTVIKNRKPNTSFLYWTNADGVTIQDLTLDGDYTGTQVGLTSGGHLVFVNSNDVTVRNVVFRNFRRIALLAFNDHQTTITNVYENLIVDGVEIYGPNNYVNNVGPSAIIIADYNNSVIRNSYIEKIGQYGYEFKNDSSNNLISNCVAVDTYRGICFGGDGARTDLLYVKNSVVESCILVDCAEPFWLGTAANNVIQNCESRTTADGPTPSRATIAIQSSSNNRVQNFHIVGRKRFAVDIRGNSTGNAVEFSLVDGAHTGEAVSIANDSTGNSVVIAWRNHDTIVLNRFRFPAQNNVFDIRANYYYRHGSHTNPRIENALTNARPPYTSTVRGLVQFGDTFDVYTNTNQASLYENFGNYTTAVLSQVRHRFDTGSKTETIWAPDGASSVSYIKEQIGFRPGSDNALRLGAPDARWSVVHAASGTISTSDGREKQDIEALNAAELRVAANLKSLVRKFRFKDAVQAKGDAARIHVGVIAQDVIAAFQAEGLDATRYGIVCYDEWEELPEERDEAGNVVQEYRPAGNRYGVRYEELLAFIIGAM